MTADPHPLVTLVARAVGRPSPAAERYLALLQRRLIALAQVARGGEPDDDRLGLSPSDRARARRFLRSRHGRWHDGDENLVRGWLDRWDRSAPRPAALATALLGAADALSSIEARPETLWFFLWEMESVLDGLRC